MGNGSVRGLAGLVKEQEGAGGMDKQKAYNFAALHRKIVQAICCGASFYGFDTPLLAAF